MVSCFVGLAVELALFLVAAGKPFCRNATGLSGDEGGGKEPKIKTPEAHHTDPCHIRFDSPMTDMAEAMHDLVTRVSVIAAKEANTAQRVKYFGAETVPSWLGDAQFSRACLALGILTDLLLLFDLVYIW